MYYNNDLHQWTPQFAECVERTLRFQGDVFGAPCCFGGVPSSVLGAKVDDDATCVLASDCVGYDLIQAPWPKQL